MIRRLTKVLSAPRDRAGFTLIEIVIAVAIVAILAGTMTPVIYGEIQRAREKATDDELATLRAGLLDFYDDTGRLPSEAEGLVALLTDPGATGWAGPYVSGEIGDPGANLTTDSWGNTYQYDLSPTTTPADAAQALVASAGSDKVLAMGSIGATWDLTPDNDDQHVLIAAGPLERNKTRAAEVEMNALAAAARRYFADQAAFPTVSSDLSGTYLDAGLNGEAFIDPWHTAYELTVDTGGAQPPDWVIRSYGPNRTDDSGGGDDLTLNVSSVPPARESTLYRLEVAQLILNKDPNLALTGDWPGTDRGALNLASVFDADGWGRDFQLNVASRLIFSTGADGVAATTTDNIPVGVGP